MASDNFNRADENPLSGGGAWAGTGSAVKLQSNAILHGAGGGSDAFVYRTDSSVASSQVTVVAPGGRDAGPGIHMDAAGNGYVGNNNDGGNFYIFRLPTFTSLAFAPGVYAAADQLRLRRSGGNVIFSKNGVDIVTATDSTFTGGAPGAHFFDGTTTFDDWTDGAASSIDIVAAGGARPSGQATLVATSIDIVAAGGARPAGQAELLPPEGDLFVVGDLGPYSVLGGYNVVGGGLVAATPTLAIVASGGAVPGGAAVLTTALAVQAAGGALPAGAATLSTALALQAPAGAVPAGVANLSTVIAVAAAGGALGAGAAALGTAIALQGSGQAQPSGVAQLQIAGSLVAAAGARPGGLASLSTAIALQAAGQAQPGGAAALLIGSTLVATGGATPSGLAVLTTSLALQAGGQARPGGAAALQAVMAIAAAGGAQPAAVAQLSTAIALQAAGGAVPGGGATLLAAAAGLVAQGAARPGGAASLVTAISIAAAGGAQPLGSANLVALLAGADRTVRARLQVRRVVSNAQPERRVTSMGTAQEVAAMDVDETQAPITFDFTDELAAVGAVISGAGQVTFEVDVRAGRATTPDAILAGSPQLDVTQRKVTQAITPAGREASFAVRCRVAASDGKQYVAVALFSVERM